MARSSRGRMSAPYRVFSAQANDIGRVSTTAAGSTMRHLTTFLFDDTAILMDHRSPDACETLCQSSVWRYQDLEIGRQSLPRWQRSPTASFRVRASYAMTYRSLRRRVAQTHHCIHHLILERPAATLIRCHINVWPDDTRDFQARSIAFTPVTGNALPARAACNPPERRRQ